MIKKIIISLLLFVFMSLTPLFASIEVSSLASNWFGNFSKNISLKYNSETEIKYFQGFTKKLNELLYKKSFNEAQTTLINDLITLSNERVFMLKKSKLENSTIIRLKTNSLLKGFKKLLYNPNLIFKENGIWYTYNYESYLSFATGTKITTKDLEFNGINKEKTLVFIKDDGTLGFINNYTKVKLISDSIIYGIPGKYNFLKEVKDDKRLEVSESDSKYISLKNKSIEISKGKSQKDKISAIYNFVLDNVEYTKTFKLEDAPIYSGIATFENKNGVCEGYSKLLLFMLNFAGINNSEVIRGYVLDAQDFPKVGHAWIKIGDKYYDPTFDDPIGLEKTRKEYEYDYFKLPYDLFYTNRYTFDTLPSYLKDEDLEYRKEFVTKRITPLVSKYKYSNYNILKIFTLKNDYSIPLDKKLDIEDLKKIIEFHEVDNFTYSKLGITKSIKTLKYFLIDQSDIESIIEQLKYNFKGHYLYHWKLENGTYEYRLAYDVSFN